MIFFYHWIPGRKEQFKQFSNRFYRWFLIHLKYLCLLSLFRLDWWKRCDEKWHALHPIHMHYVRSQTDDWLYPKKIHKTFVSSCDTTKGYTQSSGTVAANKPPSAANRILLSARTHKCRLYLSLFQAAAAAGS